MEKPTLDEMPPGGSVSLSLSPSASVSPSASSSSSVSASPSASEGEDGWGDPQSGGVRIDSATDLPSKLETPYAPPSGAADKSQPSSPADTTGAVGSGAAGKSGTQMTSQSTTPSAEDEISHDVLDANVGDQPSASDSLGFTPYVEAIASFLTNKVTKPPLTLSIEGEWGSGKSSFMLQLEEQLRLWKVSVVRFNAWRYDKDDAMWAAFALEFARKLVGELSLFARWWAHLKLFFKRFQWERGWMDLVRLLLMLMGLLLIVLLPILMWDRIIAFVTSADSFSSILGKALGGIVRAGGILGYVGLIVLLWLKLKNTLGNPLKINLKQYLDTPDYKSRVAFIERFHQDFGNIAKTYGRGEKICVFIDDLDRCEVPKAADLMQALNLMISDDKDSQLIFIMGMDREKVAAGLAVKYEKLLPYLAPAPTGNAAQTNAAFDPVLGLEYGYGFIEKFIQLPFQVPQASDNQVDEFLKMIFGSADSSSPKETSPQRYQAAAAGERAEQAVTQDSEIVTQILKMVAPTFDYNPRRLKQFINAFRLKTFIASRTGLFGLPAEPDKYGQLTIQQLGKFVAISLHWPLLLADLDNERDLLSRLQSLVLGKLDPEALKTRDVNAQEVLKPSVTVGQQKEVKITDSLARWYRRENLRRFLGVKLFKEDGSLVGPETERTYSLEKLDVNKLLQVSPLTAGPAQSTSAAKAEGATARSHQTAAA